MRIAVHLQREIARLHYYDVSQSNRAIGRALLVSHNTVQTLRAALHTLDKPWAELQTLDDAQWIAVLGTKDRSIAQRKPTPDWNWVHTEMQRPDATREQLWREFRMSHPDGIGNTQFAAGYRQWRKAVNIVLRQTHTPGEKLFVDFAGRTVEIKDRQGGPSSYAQIFVAVLGYSNYTFVLAVASQKTADWLLCNIECFNAFGGVPEWVVPDNLKAAVLRREKDSIVLNPAYRECLRHYDTAPLPAGPRKPKGKAKVEVGVQIVQRWVLFPIRDWDFFSLNELNAELRKRVAALNAHPFKKMSGSRADRFFNVEQKKLKPLPETPFELCEWRYGVRAGDDYHVEHKRSFYSVPCELRNHKVDLRYTATMLRIMYQSRQVALHPLATSEGEIHTIPEHRPLAHVRVLEGEPRLLMVWAESVGPNTTAMIRHHLSERHDITNGVRAARKMRDLARLFSDRRFEEACAYALPLNITSLRSMESILKQSPDKNAASVVPQGNLLTHDNLRGATYYGDAE